MANVRWLGVDIIVDQEGMLIPLEVKRSATPRPAMGKQAAPGYVVHTGGTTLPLARGVTAPPFSDL